MIKSVKTDKALKPVGPYSQGIVVGDYIFVAGQVGIHPTTGEISEKVADQTKQTLENIKAIVEAAGTTMSNIVKTTVFLADINTFDEMNRAYAQYFKDVFPARTTVQAKLARAMFKVEIDAIAYIEK